VIEPCGAHRGALRRQRRGHANQRAIACCTARSGNMGPMDELTQRRIGFNETAFRDVNEAVEAGRGLRNADELLAFVCECARLGCNQLLSLSVTEYEAVRRNPRQFVIVDGHELPETEDVVERHERYSVVEKRAAGAEVAEQRDPRAGGGGPPGPQSS
jgi:hypothetical protein